MFILDTIGFYVIEINWNASDIYHLVWYCFFSNFECFFLFQSLFRVPEFLRFLTVIILTGENCLFNIYFVFLHHHTPSNCVFLLFLKKLFLHGRTNDTCNTVLIEQIQQGCSRYTANRNHHRISMIIFETPWISRYWLNMFILPLVYVSFSF